MTGEGALSLCSHRHVTSHNTRTFSVLCATCLAFIEVATTNAICAVACYILTLATLHSTLSPVPTLLPSLHFPLPPPLFHFATRHFLWLISLIACGLRKLVKIFLLAPKLPLPPTLPRPLLLLQLPPSKCAPKYAMLFATLT